MTEDRAQTIALQALAWLIAEDDLRDAFMGANNLGAADLRAGAADPAFLAAVLAFITSEDGWVVAFCDQAGLAYEEPLQARYALPGAQETHWT